VARLSSKPFPPYQFLPGLAPHPEKEGGYLFGHKLNFSKLEEKFLLNSDFCYAIDLIEARYYWEAHVYLEGLWNQVRKDKKQEAAFLQSLILFCAAGVKALLGSSDAAKAHLVRSLELMAEVQNLAEFNLEKIREWMKAYDFKRPTSFPV
jgi:hypothetical protein